MDRVRKSLCWGGGKEDTIAILDKKNRKRLTNNVTFQSRPGTGEEANDGLSDQEFQASPRAQRWEHTSWYKQVQGDCCSGQSTRGTLCPPRYQDHVGQEYWLVLGVRQELVKSC